MAVVTVILAICIATGVELLFRIGSLRGSVFWLIVVATTLVATCTLYWWTFPALRHDDLPWQMSVRIVVTMLGALVLGVCPRTVYLVALWRRERRVDKHSTAAQ